MKVSNEEREQFKVRYKELIEKGGVNKTQAIAIIADEFDRGKTTIFDNLSYEDEPKVASKPLEAVAPIAQNESKGAKILVFDIETFANLGFIWGKYDQNVIDFEREWFVLCFCYKWYGEDEVYSISLPDYPEDYARNNADDYQVVRAMWNLFDEADIVIAHNGDKFDIKKMYARFLYHQLPPPSPFKSIDTVKIARRYFSMNSNKLDDIGRYLGIGRKKVNTGWDLWKRCFSGDMKAWQEMIDYNSQDVVLLEKVYDRFKPYIQNHPNLNLYNETNESCPNRGSSNLQKRGYAFSRVAKTQRYQCTNCGSWSSGNKVVR